MCYSRDSLWMMMEAALEYHQELILSILGMLMHQTHHQSTLRHHVYVSWSTVLLHI